MPIDSSSLGLSKVAFKCMELFLLIVESFDR